MKSRKLVLINSFVKKEWRCRSREWTCGHSGGRRKLKAKVSQLCLTLCDPIDCIEFMEFSRSEYWSG